MFQNGDYYCYLTGYKELRWCILCIIENWKEDDMGHITYLRELDQKCTENPGILIYLDE